MHRMLQFRQEATPDHQLLWSVIFNEHGEVIHGRPDAEYIIGFGPKDGYEVTVTARQGIEDPSSIVGLCPVFQLGGNMFSVNLAVNEWTRYEREPEVVEKLRLRELEMRKAVRDA